MNIDIVLLSIIQGIGEFLPVSSSVNLHLFSSLLRMTNFSFSFKVALHMGSLLTLLFYFRKEIHEIIRAIFSKKHHLTDTYFFSLLFGTIPVVFFGYFARDFVKHFDSPVVMGISSIIFGVLLLIFDKISCLRGRGDKSPVSILKSFIIGCFQAIAVFPGVSRLGICITASRMLSLDRKKAIFFSLFLAIPSILGSVALEMHEAYNGNQIKSLFNIQSIYGILLTMTIGTFIITFAVRFMEKRGFLALTIYRIIIGALICFL